MKKTILRKAFAASLPILGGYLALGIGFGVLLTTAGYSFMWALAMSVTMLSGSLQYVGVELLSSGASLLTVALTSLMVNARHLFYGITMIDKYSGAGIKKLYMMFGMTDETFSLVCEDRKELTREEFQWYAFFITLFDHIYWITGCLAGSLLGNIIPFDTTGIDFVLTALFIVVVVQQWMDYDDHRPAIIGAAASVISILIFGSERFLIPAMVMISIALCLIRPKEDRNADR